MGVEESLDDVAIRERQLAAHILRSAKYLRHADQELKRQVSMLYLAIALLLLFQGLFSVRAMSQVSTAGFILVTVTSFLAIANCVLLIKTKMGLRRLNKAWLAPQEKDALDALQNQRDALLTRSPGVDDEPDLNEIST